MSFENHRSASEPFEADQLPEFHQSREELIQAYNPTTDLQRELINLLADSCEQLRESHRLRKLITEKGVAGLTAEEFEDYKALIHRGVEEDLMELRQFKPVSAPAAPQAPAAERQACNHTGLKKPRR